MNQETLEILDYLEPREDYVIWAGFAQFAHLGIKPSPDIDIFIQTLNTKNRISGDFKKKSWKKVLYKGFYKYHDKLEKNGTTFDIVHSEAAVKLFFPTKMKINVEGYSLYFLSPESLFLTKLGQLTVAKRTAEKRERDCQTVNGLRDKIDIKKLKELVSKLPDSYWRVGWV